jgi:hypothetical protein
VLSWRSASFCLLALVAACSSSEQPAPRPAFTRDELLDPKNCKDCHPKHYNEWSMSMHAYATKDPVFQAMNRRGQEATNGALGKFCLQCHAPMAVADDKITDFSHPEALPEHLQGVTCYFCHNAIETGPDHFNGNIKLANDTTMRAALDRAQIPSVHKVAYSVNHDNQHAESSVMCGTCHDIRNTFAHDFPLEKTFAEWQQSFFSAPGAGFQSCQTCHMRESRDSEPIAISSGYPGVPTSSRHPHEHLWAGVDVALTPFPGMDVMQSAVEECELRGNVQYLDVELQAPTAAIQVSFETLAGHAQPSGATQDRRMWMEVVGKDTSGKVIFQAGQVADGEPEETPDKPHPCLMRSYVVDENGKETHNFWEAAAADPVRGSTLIPVPATAQAGSHTRVCPFRPPGFEPIPHLELTLRMRPMGIDVLQDLVASGHLAKDVIARMPTHTVWTRTADYDPTTRRYLVDAPRPDCDKYQCLLDPKSAYCASGSSAAAGAPASSGGAAGAR